MIHSIEQMNSSICHGLFMEIRNFMNGCSFLRDIIVVCFTSLCVLVDALKCYH